MRRGQRCLWQQTGTYKLLFIGWFMGCLSSDNNGNDRVGRVNRDNQDERGTMGEKEQWTHEMVDISQAISKSFFVFFNSQ